MDINIVITSTLVSSGIASLVSFLLRQYYDRRLEFNFNKKLEQLKTELGMQSDFYRQYSSHQMEIYPHLTELVYRLRNELRDLKSADAISLENITQYTTHLDAFTEAIYASRWYLDQDQVFTELHDYKNLASSARNLLMDWAQLAGNGEDCQTIRLSMDAKFGDMDRQYEQVVQHLTRLIKK